MPQFKSLGLDGVYEIIPDCYEDDRGFFSESYGEKDFLNAGLDVRFVQDNHSVSRNAFLLRGLHFQVPPFAQAKLVRITRGSVLDVIVDLRKESPTFSKWIKINISAEKWNQVFIPEGFAHAFLTLEANTECLYKVSAPYSPEHERIIRFDDPELNIDWQVDAALITLSKKDEEAGSLSQLYHELWDT